MSQSERDKRYVATEKGKAAIARKREREKTKRQAASARRRATRRSEATRSATPKMYGIPMNEWVQLPAEKRQEIVRLHTHGSKVLADYFARSGETEP